MFLMHRVELKGASKQELIEEIKSVPNAPCGVERSLTKYTFTLRGMVPNAPCGVERIVDNNIDQREVCS